MAAQLATVPQTNLIPLGWPRMLVNVPLIGATTFHLFTTYPIEPGWVVRHRRAQFLPYAAARLSLHDAGFVFGATVSDLCRTFRHRLFRLSDHLARFADSCRLVGIDLGPFFHHGASVLDPEIHAPRPQYKYFYDEMQPGGVLSGMQQALKKMKQG